MPNDQLNGIFQGALLRTSKNGASEWIIAYKSLNRSAMTVADIGLLE